MGLNALSALRLSDAVLAPMRVRVFGYGRIVRGSVGATHKRFARAGVYAASKAAAFRSTAAVAEENKAQGTTAHCVLPGAIDTPQNRVDMPTADHLLWVSPTPIEATVALLVSREAGAVIGAAVPIAGRQ